MSTPYPRATSRSPPPALGADCALFLDIDGTLLELAPTPAAVHVDAGVKALLPALADRLGGAVALITGRAMADADRLFRGLALPIAGQHGLERRRADGSLHRHLPPLNALDRLRSVLSQFAARHDGLFFEDKGATLALHYRQAPQLASFVHRTLRTHMTAALAFESGWRLQPGKSILEIKPDGRDKGTAILEYLTEAPFAGRLPVFVGDDLTDEYGFAAVTSARGCAVKVGRGQTNAQFRLRDVAAVRAWLAELHSKRREILKECRCQAISISRSSATAPSACSWIRWVPWSGAASRASTATPPSARCSTMRRPARSAASTPWRSSMRRAPSNRTSTNTAVLVTRLFDQSGGAIEITDCVPRFMQHGRVFHPMTHVRTVRRVAGRPRIRVRLRPASGYGRAHPTITVGSSHIRYVMPGVTLRLTTDASLTAILEERPFFLDEDLTLLLGPDETVPSAVPRSAAGSSRKRSSTGTTGCEGSRYRSNGRSAVIRAAITLQQNAYDDTGAIVAAMTTSIPEAAGSPRNWDYRYCWLRDGYFVVDALNRLGATETMERYLGYIVGIVAGVAADSLQPVYRINGDVALGEDVVKSCRAIAAWVPCASATTRTGRSSTMSMAPRSSPSTHVFFDERLVKRGDEALFERLETLGRAGARPARSAGCRHVGTARQPRACTRSRASCAGPRAIGSRGSRRGSGSPNAPRLARRCRDHPPRFIEDRCWNETRRSFVGTADGDTLDASLLLLADIGFLRPEDPRFAADGRTRSSRRADARRLGLSLCRAGRFRRARERVRRLHVLVRQRACRTRAPRRSAKAVRAAARLPQPHGLLAEHLDPRTGEHWGNFVQTYSMVGLITSAMRLSVPWDTAV